MKHTTQTHAHAHTHTRTHIDTHKIQADTIREPIHKRFYFRQTHSYTKTKSRAIQF